MTKDELIGELFRAAQIGDVNAIYDVAQRLRAASAAPTGFVPLTREELLAPLPDIDYLLEPLDFCPGRPCTVVGTGGSGKTLAMQSLVLSCITGRSAWNQFRVKQGDVVHVDAEMARCPTIRRYRALCDGMGASWEHDIVDHLSLVSMPDIFLNTPGVQDHIERLVDGKVLCFMDSLRRLLPGEDENDSSLSSFIDPLTRVSERTGTTFVLCHHSSTKTFGAPGDVRGAGRGTSAIFDASGSQILLSNKPGEPTKVVHLRAPMSGKFEPPFYLSIESTQPGLRVTYQTEEQVDGPSGGKTDKLRAYEDIKEQIVRVCGQADVRSLRVLEELVTGNAKTIRAAIAEMSEEGHYPRLRQIGNRWRVEG